MNPIQSDRLNKIMHHITETAHIPPRIVDVMYDDDDMATVIVIIRLPLGS